MGLSEPKTPNRDTDSCLRSGFARSLRSKCARPKPGSEGSEAALSLLPSSASHCQYLRFLMLTMTMTRAVRNLTQSYRLTHSNSTNN